MFFCYCSFFYQIVYIDISVCSTAHPNGQRICAWWLSPKPNKLGKKIATFVSIVLPFKSITFSCVANIRIHHFVVVCFLRNITNSSCLREQVKHKHNSEAYPRRRLIDWLIIWKAQRIPINIFLRIEIRLCKLAGFCELRNLHIACWLEIILRLSVREDRVLVVRGSMHSSLDFFAFK